LPVAHSTGCARVEPSHRSHKLDPDAMNARRRFLLSLAALGAAGSACAPPETRPRWRADPFSLGVASGYPSPSSVVLWTRLAPEPSQPGGGLDPVPVSVRWEIAHDEAMRSIAASGTTLASPDWAHAVHVEVRALEPGRWYWYRFAAADAQSPVGRTRTAPPAGTLDPRLRFVFASCQHYEQGYYGAWRHAAADAPDLVAFLGDYIYESPGGREPVREHGAPEPYTLEAYRARYALYRRDRDLQAAHAACPWVLVWDDHEVDNDYANEWPEDDMPAAAFLARRAAAYRAYYEHQPLPASMRPDGPAMRIHTTLDWGGLARFCLLDDRQYRSRHACPRSGRFGGSNTVDIAQCPELFDPGRTMLGAAQERWLETELARSPARWNVLAQQTSMAQFDQLPGEGRRAWTDGWDGYPLARRRVLDFAAARPVANPVVIGGDVHAFAVSELKSDFDDAAAPVVASEFISTSISSRSRAQETIDKFLPDNPHIRLVDSRHRGYVRVDLVPNAWRADLRAMASVQTPDAACSTLASFVVEDGRPKPQRA
jgi:alkaline phosphatase D